MEKNSNENIGIKELIDTGSNITGSVTGAVTGAIIGLAIGTTIKR